MAITWRAGGPPSRCTPCNDVSQSEISRGDSPLEYKPTVDAIEASGPEYHAPITVTPTENNIDHDDHIASFRLEDLPADGTLFLDAAIENPKNNADTSRV